MVWDNYQNTASSETASFSTALLSSTDWQADWIGAPDSDMTVPPNGFFKDARELALIGDTVHHDGQSLLLRKNIQCTQDILSATAHISGLGFYEFYINGRRVGDNVLAPSKTNYINEVLYDTHDVTNYLKKGPNGIGIHLGNGWYNPYKKWWKEYRMQWFGAKRASLQIHIQYKDGSSEVVKTDNTWKSSKGPVIYNCIYDGEVYDSNLEQPDWSQSSFDDSLWQPTITMNSPGGQMVAHRMPQIKVIEKKTPLKSWEGPGNVILYDMGQNFAGWVKIALEGNQGTKVRIRFAEDIKEDGSLDPSSNERAKAEATYIMHG
jgi:alpha-L-rhamnosidase